MFFPKSLYSSSPIWRVWFLMQPDGRWRAVQLEHQRLHSLYWVRQPPSLACYICHLEVPAENLEGITIGYGEYKGIYNIVPNSLNSRIGLTIIRVLLGVILLADVSFKATYRELQDFPLLQSGLTEMNTSILHDPAFMYYATANFWWHFPAIFTYSHAVAPTTCSGDKCKAFFFSSPLSLLKFLPNSPNVSTTDSPLATTFVEKNSPGYQIEFSPIDIGKDPLITLSDCRVFGIPILAFQLCLKETNDSRSLIAGNPPPKAVTHRSLECLSVRRCWTDQLSKHHSVAHECTKQHKNDHRKTSWINRFRPSKSHCPRRNRSLGPDPRILQTERFFRRLRTCLQNRLEWNEYTIIDSLFTFTHDFRVSANDRR